MDELLNPLWFCPSMSEQTVIAKNTASLFLAEGFGAIASFVLIVTLSYLIGNEGLGKYSFVLAYAGIFAVFYDFGIDTLLIRDIAQDKSKIATYIPTMLTMRILFFFLMIIPPGASIIIKESDPIIIASVIVASFGVFFIYLSYFFRSLLQAVELIVIDARIKAVENSLLLLSALLGVYYFGLFGAIVGVTFSQFLTLMYSWRCAKKRVAGWHLGFDKKLARVIFKKSLPFWFTGTFLIIYFRIDSIMIESLRNFREVGLYNAAMKLVSGFHFVPKVFLMAIFPVMARFFTINKQDLTILLRQTIRWLTCLGVPIAIGGFVLSKQFISLVYADAFDPAANAFGILAISEAIFFLTYGFGNFLNSINKPSAWAWITGISVVFNIICNFLFIPNYGFVGAAIATLISQLAVMISLSIVIKRSGYEIHFIQTIWKFIVAGSVMGGVVYFLPPMFVLFKVLIGLLVYGIFLLFLREITKEDQDLVLSLLRRSKQ